MIFSRIFAFSLHWFNWNFNLTVFFHSRRYVTGKRLKSHEKIHRCSSSCWLSTQKTAKMAVNIFWIKNTVGVNKEIEHQQVVIFFWKRILSEEPWNFCTLALKCCIKRQNNRWQVPRQPISTQTRLLLTNHITASSLYCTLGKLRALFRVFWDLIWPKDTRNHNSLGKTPWCLKIEMLA